MSDGLSCSLGLQAALLRTNQGQVLADGGGDMLFVKKTKKKEDHK